MPKLLYILTICSLLFLTVKALDSASDARYFFKVERRLNAHGDEFMALALTSDGRRLIVGTESGRLIVWGIQEKRILKQLDQGSPVHRVVTLQEPETFVAVGGPHVGATHRGVIRKWHIGSGKFKELPGSNQSTFLTLTSDPATGVIAAGDGVGNLMVWNVLKEQSVLNRKLGGMISGIALLGREVFLSKVLPEDAQENKLSPNSILRLSIDRPNQPPTQFLKEDGKRVWSELEVSPDRRFIAAHASGESNGAVVIFEIATGKEIASFDAHSAEWSTNRSLVLFDREVAIARITIDDNNRVSRSDLMEGAEWHGAGDPANMTGQIVSPDGSKIWSIFQLGATLVESDLDKKSSAAIHNLRTYVYSMHVRDELGLIATGGDDEFVRVRKLSDLSLIREFRVDPGVPQGVALLNDGRHVVFSASGKDAPTKISLGDLVSGDVRTLFEVPDPFVEVVRAGSGFIYDRYDRLVLVDGMTGTKVRELKFDPPLHKFAVSANGEWAVAANDEGKLYCFEIKTGRRVYVSKEDVDSLTRLTITNDGRYVYTTEFRATLRRWDTRTDTMKELASIRGQARTLMLSSDEKRITVGGNHRDVEVYDVATGESLSAFEVAASDFYVTNVWLGGDRVLFTTDAGVMFDGRLRPSPKTR